MRLVQDTQLVVGRYGVLVQNFRHLGWGRAWGRADLETKGRDAASAQRSWFLALGGISHISRQLARLQPRRRRAGGQREAPCSECIGTLCDRMNNGPPSFFPGMVVRGTYWLTA